MHFKVDENLPVEACLALRAAGHDAVSVIEQRMGGSPDSEVIAVCVAESRVLVTLDTDFANMLVYPPKTCCGIIVFRTEDQSKPAVARLVEQVVSALGSETPLGKLWIVEPGRIRIRGEA